MATAKTVSRKKTTPKKAPHKKPVTRKRKAGAVPPSQTQGQGAYEGTGKENPYELELKTGAHLTNPSESVTGVVLTTLLHAGRRCYKLRLTSGAIGEAYVPVDDFGDWHLVPVTSEPQKQPAEPEADEAEARAEPEAPAPKKRRKKASKVGDVGLSPTTTQRIEALVETYDEAAAQLPEARASKKRARAQFDAAQERVFQIVHEADGTMGDDEAEELTGLERKRAAAARKIEQQTAFVTQLKETMHANVEAVFEQIRDARDGTGLFD